MQRIILVRTAPSTSIVTTCVLPLIESWNIATLYDESALLPIVDLLILLSEKINLKFTKPGLTTIDLTIRLQKFYRPRSLP